ncbi:hypothetical protein SODALDRAFT_358849 [Sodiomyces alkalinus F11]|uniref:Uncharacterized protein n=1 Tax=Sodiomyces alkalinus (strain CBS 110278 / VKM F-3762 / F11) TaxID=1314773 RepID=A0A3N2PWV6_SODAK|nr:hypothetical protein SODALDRAFT_358849 [Sodiomyces alkalinus F11]ROT39003.1 hypothetical protein SODALDRAFT_358849 [Sodiomyces alkalinus F11]
MDDSMSEGELREDSGLRAQDYGVEKEKERSCPIGLTDGEERPDNLRQDRDHAAGTLTLECDLHSTFSRSSDQGYGKWEVGMGNGELGNLEQEVFLRTSYFRCKDRRRDMKVALLYMIHLRRTISFQGQGSDFIDFGVWKLMEIRFPIHPPLLNIHPPRICSFCSEYDVRSGYSARKFGIEGPPGPPTSIVSPLFTPPLPNQGARFGHCSPVFPLTVTPHKPSLLVPFPRGRRALAELRASSTTSAVPAVHCRQLKPLLVPSVPHTPQVFFSTIARISTVSHLTPHESTRFPSPPPSLFSRPCLTISNSLYSDFFVVPICCTTLTYPCRSRLFAGMGYGTHVIHSIHQITIFGALHRRSSYESRVPWACLERVRGKDETQATKSPQKPEAESCQAQPPNPPIAGFPS